MSPQVVLKATETKTKIRYEVAGVPDVAMTYRRFSIRPDEAIVNITDGSVTSVLVAGQSVRRNGTLGARHREIFSRWDVTDGEVPQWVEDLVAATGVPWYRLPETTR